MAESEGGRAFLKWGCIGCLGCLGVIALLIGVAVGVGWLSARNVTLEDQVVERELPASEVESEEAESKAEGEPAATSVSPSSTTAGHVFLDLNQGEFHVEPGEPGAPLRVEASYDKKSHELEESLDQPADGPWTYRVRFRSIGGGGWLRGIFAPSPKVTVYLPPDVPLDLELDLAQGGAVVELGGLWLKTARITNSQGGFQISVSSPLHAPMESFELSASMGGMEIRELGNASPARLSVDCSMGGMSLDLRGEWVQDSTVELDASMGGLEVRLPRDVTVVGVPGRESALGSAEPEVRRPTLTFSVDAGAQKNIKFR